MKTQFHIKELYRKYIAGHCAEEELSLLLNYFKLPEHEELLHELVKAEMDGEGADDEHSLIAKSIVSRVDLKLQQKLAFELSEMNSQPTKPGDEKTIKLSSYRTIGRIAAAAVIFISLFAGFYFYNHYKNESSSYQAAAKIAPGGHKAILTLADGRKIVLADADNGQLAEQSIRRIVSNSIPHPNAKKKISNRTDSH